ncbi:Eaa1 [Klebsiella pneumoniae]|uniref:DUF551 domain-containing protein n=2 Tax=Klebsiella pneumoniae TaxID=573 RepID=UPI000E2DC8A5|nr:DUF551 domain-containing protein [Klebsiella pneumoniae]SWK16541.1 Eaa1 [Klebsiella pneumoniae]SWK65692.1 Eaa1 [Klebsiella pneumoniae]
MTKSTITRERLEEIRDYDTCVTLEESAELARMALAAMDSEPAAVTDDELNAALQLHRLKVDGHSQLSDAFRAGFRYARRTTPQPAPVVPAVSDDIGEIRVGRLPTMNQDDYPGLGDWWVQLRIGEDSDEVLARVYGATPQEANNRAEALACRAAMLQAEPVCTCPSGDGSLRWPCSVHPGNSPVIPDTWIPVSERMPIEFEAVIAFDGDQVYGEAMYSSDDGFTIDGYEPCDRLNLQNVTHWMPLPAAPQEVR